MGNTVFRLLPAASVPCGMHRAGRLWLLVIASLVFGAAATIGIALGCAKFSSAPPQWHQFMNEYTGRGSPEYRELQREIPDTERVVVMGCFGFGYRSQDIRYYDAEAIKLADYPPAKRRSFKTELGWPNSVIETNSRTIGARFGWRLAPNSQANGAEALHDGKPVSWRILWMGFIFDTLLGATLLLGIWTYLRAPVGAQRTRIVASCAGLWLALLTSWGCDLTMQWLGQASQWWPREIRGYSEPSDFCRNVQQIETPSPDEWDQFAAGHTRSIGYDSWYYNCSKRIPNAWKGREAIAVIAGGSSLSLGWPFTSLKGPALGPWTVTGAPARETRGRHLIELFAMPVNGPGMLGNWVLCAIIVAVLWQSPRRVRSWWRVWKSRCPHCGYPVGSSNRCTECGKPLQGK